MAYVTGGLAHGGANLTTTISQSLLPSILIGNAGKGDLYENLVGWTIGAGGERVLGRNVSAKLEYLYYDLGGLQLSTASNPLAFTSPLLGLRFIDATSVSTRFNVASTGVFQRLLVRRRRRFSPHRNLPRRKRRSSATGVSRSCPMFGRLK